ncbi:MAG: hypothetical protein COA41_11365 [Sphingopyxis sp.]|nr:MAG: hypothetical protein COA41_11365 [Sphingopyxis sp.]
MTIYTDGLTVRPGRDLLADAERYSSSMPTDERILGIVLVIAIAGLLFWVYQASRKKLDRPVNRVGFILFMLGLALVTLSLALCIVDKPSRLMFSMGLRDFFAHGFWDASKRSGFVAWQIVLMFGVVCTSIGGTMVWLYQSAVKRLVHWIRYGS